MLQKLPALLRTLMMLNPTSDVYVKTIICNTLVFNTQLGKKLPPAELFMRAFSLFNEEVGEMSFSVLSRLSKSGTINGDMDRINKLYVLIHEYVSIDDNLMVDNNKKAMRNGYEKIAKDSLTSVAVLQFMKGLVRRLKYNQFRMYDGAHAFNNPNFMPKSNEDPVLVPRLSTKIFWVDDIAPNYQSWIKKLKLSLQKPLEGLQEHWPGFFMNFRLQPPVLANEPPQIMEAPFDQVSFPDVEEGREEKCALMHTFEDSEEEEDNEALICLRLREKQKKLLEVLEEYSTKNRSYKVGQRVWSIDPPEPGEGEENWGIFSGVVEKRAIRGRIKGAVATPAFHERVLCDSLDGPPAHYDVKRTNLDVSFAKAVERLNNIKTRLNIPIPVQPAPLIVRRERTPEELARWARIQQLARAVEDIDDDGTDDDNRYFTGV